MDIRWTAVMLLGTIYPGRTDAAEKIRIDVYLQQDNLPQSPGQAEMLASHLFAGIDVGVTWHAGELPRIRNSGRLAAGIRMVKHAPASATPHALASAQPYGSSGALISVYEDRVERLLNNLPSLSHELLAYVFVHELAHVIQGNDYHSDSGIMKAQWSNEDYAAMRARRLGFANFDSDRIRGALVARMEAR
jgi:hypothetical protein